MNLEQGYNDLIESKNNLLILTRKNMRNLVFDITAKCTGNKNINKTAMSSVINSSIASLMTEYIKDTLDYINKQINVIDKSNNISVDLKANEENLKYPKDPFNLEKTINDIAQFIIVYFKKLNVYEDNSDILIKNTVDSTIKSNTEAFKKIIDSMQYYLKEKNHALIRYLDTKKKK